MTAVIANGAEAGSAGGGADHRAANWCPVKREQEPVLIDSSRHALHVRAGMRGGPASAGKPFGLLGEQRPRQRRRQDGILGVRHHRRLVHLLRRMPHDPPNSVSADQASGPKIVATALIIAGGHGGTRSRQPDVRAAFDDEATS